MNLLGRLGKYVALVLLISLNITLGWSPSNSYAPARIKITNETTFIRTGYVRTMIKNNWVSTNIGLYSYCLETRRTGLKEGKLLPNQP